MTMPGGLRLFVRCHEHVLALETALIERLLLADDVPPPDPPAILGPYPSAPRACLGVLNVAEVAWVAWDLAGMLGLAPVHAAYLLLRLPEEPSLHLALRTGRCLHVGEMTAAAPPLALPPGLWQSRAGSLRAAFAMGGGVGLDLDGTSLFTQHERAFARELLTRADVTEHGRLDGLV
jgi:hypothetical protein